MTLRLKNVEDAQGPVTIYLAPNRYLMSQKAYFAIGDDVTVNGYEAGEGVVTALEVRKGGKTFALRDNAGRPAWRAGRGGRFAH